MIWPQLAAQPARPSRRLPPRRRLQALATMTATATALAALSSPTRAQPAAPAVPSVPAADPGPRAYGIPGGALADVLARFAEQSGAMLSWSAADLVGKHSDGLSGSHDLESALATVLRGTQMQARREANGGFVLVPLAVSAAPHTPAGAAPAPTLPAVTVTATAGVLPGELLDPYPGNQVARGGRVGILGDIRYLNAPYSQTSYTAKFLEDRQAGTVGEALTVDPAVWATQGNAGQGMNEEFLVRGLKIGAAEGSPEGATQINGLYGIAPNYTSLTYFVERVEMLKGPDALLNGASPSASLGGSINLVAKRAADEPLTRLSVDYASRSQVGTHVDLGRRFGPDGAWGIRVNGRYQAGDTVVKDQYVRGEQGALALDYRRTGFRAALDLIGQSRPYRRSNFYLGMWSYEGERLPGAPDPTISNSDPAVRSDERNNAGIFSAELDLAPDWSLFASAGTSRWHYSGVEIARALLNEDGDVSRDLGAFRIWNHKQSYRAGLRGKASTGPLSHRLVLSADHYNSKLGSGYQPGGLLANGNIYLSSPAENPAIEALALPGLTRRTQFTSVAVADTVGWLDDRLLVTLGLRHQRIRQDRYEAEDGNLPEHYDRSAVTPTLGVVFKPIKNLAVFGNTIQGLTQGDVGPDRELYPEIQNPGAIMPPYKTRQAELGLKYDGGRFGSTLSVFRINKPSASVGPDNVFGINGQQRNEGIELGLFGEPVKGIRLLGGFTLLRARLRQTPDGELEGRTAIGVPKRMVKLQAEWDSPWVRGLTLIGGGIHSGRVYANADNSLAIPGWTVWEAGARYTTTVVGKEVTLRANVFNLANKQYWSSVTSWQGLYPGAPRTLLLSASVDL